MQMPELNSKEVERARGSRRRGKRPSNLPSMATDLERMSLELMMELDDDPRTPFSRNLRLLMHRLEEASAFAKGLNEQRLRMQ
jgi:hypothetical protein